METCTSRRKVSSPTVNSRMDSVLTFFLVVMKTTPPYPTNNPLYLRYASDFPVRGVLNKDVQRVGFIKFLSPRFCYYEAYRRLLWPVCFSAESLAQALLPDRLRTTEFLDSVFERYVKDFVTLGAPSRNAPDYEQRASEFPSFMFALIDYFASECISEISPTNPRCGLITDSDVLKIDLLTLYASRFNE